MLSFFRINDPFRYLAIVLLLILLSSIYIWVLNVPLLQPELVWMLTGERMAAGFHMYVDIIDDTGPLSAGTYWLINLVFGRSILAYKLLAFLIVIYQIIYINGLFIRYKSFDENTYIPALIMVVLFHFSFDLITLSPALMSSTFIILALGQLFSQTVLQKDGADSILLMGIFGGIATCFHLPMVIFLPYLIVVGIAVSGFSFNQLLLSLLGYFLPLVCCATYYFWMDGLLEFIQEFLLATRIVNVYAHIRLQHLLLLIALPVLFAWLGYFIGAILKVITVNQQKQKQLIIFFLIFSLISFFLSNRQTSYQLIILIPGITYFITQIFIYLKSDKIKQILFIGFLIAVPVIGYSWTFFQISSGQIASYAVMKGDPEVVSAGKRTVVLGEDLSYYQDALLATPYLNFRLSKRVLEDIDDFYDLASIYQVFVREKPELIIDEEGIFERLIKRIPLLENDYRKQKEGIYVLRKN